MDGSAFKRVNCSSVPWLGVKLCSGVGKEVSGDNKVHWDWQRTEQDGRHSMLMDLVSGQSLGLSASLRDSKLDEPPNGTDASPTNGGH